MSTAPAGTNNPSRKSFAQVAAAANRPAIPHVKTPNNATDIDSNENKASENVQKIGTSSPTAANRHTTMPLQPVAAPQPSAPVGGLSRMMKETSIDDRSPHASSVGNTGRKDNSDTKSTASRTTLTLDEKESLRPDDSASMQGGHDEEVTSPSDPIVPEFTINGDSDARAFRDQLYEIDRHEAKPVQLVQRPVSQDSLAQTRDGGPVFPQAALHPATSESSNGPISSSGPPPGLVVPPDEKLVEALNSPKDRLFVLKIEQDFIDFIVNSKEVELQLPSTNTFYRLLSHKLAEYYFLGHVYEESLKAVRIRKLPHTRLAPALIGSEPKSGAATPPPAGSMKIMRRGIEDPKLPALDGRPQSSSEYDGGDKGVGEGTKDGQKRPADKANLSREEREKQYAEVRARIFEDVKEGTSENGEAPSSQSKEMSRSSSNSGPKKNKRGKRPKDDSFEARSSYTSINGQAYPNSSFVHAPNDMAYFNTYPAYPQYAPGPGTYQANPQSFQMHTQDFASPGAWHNHPAYGQQYQMQPNTGSFAQFNPGHYDSSNSYYQSPHMGSQSTPKPHQPELAGYFPTYQNQPEVSGWAQGSFQGAYGQPNVFAANHNHFSHMIPPGYDPNAAYTPGYAAFNHQQFNPQSQSFIPSAQMGPVPGWQPQTPSNYSSPHIQQVSPRKGNQAINGRGKNHQHNQNGQFQNSSIAKWAAPSSLPAKPPPTTSTLSFQMPRHMEQGQPLPSKPLGTNGRA